uniref:Uncharacterized protein n=1 Tax=Leersia perrieri TaxID=77586 RepID=A0A0D9XXV2_9ORYZ
MASGGGGTTPSTATTVTNTTKERITRRPRRASMLLRSVAAAVLVAAFTGILVFYALCATGAVFSPPGGVAALRKVGSSATAWAVYCLVADVVVISGLMVERFRVRNGKAAASMAAMAAVSSRMLEDAVPAPMNMC